MVRIKKSRIFAADFETTVYDNQEITEVWSAATCELYTEDVKVFGCIDDMFEYYAKKIKGNVIVYFHNLKFDGSFWIDWLLRVKKYEQAFEKDGVPFDTLPTFKPETIDGIESVQTKNMKNNQFNYLISSLGQWYSIIIKTNNKLIEIRDSLKLLPFALKKLGKDFKTKHQKLDMEYKGFRYPNCYISPEEMEYIKNDVLVLKEALEIMFNEGHKKLTIGSCCLSEFKSLYHPEEYKYLFPNLYEMPLDKEIFGCDNIGDYVRQSYRGGWTYLAKGKERQIKTNGFTADVNSLYPSMMSSESGNVYPVGIPIFWSGNYIPEQAEENYYFIRIKTQFYIKKGYLPFIQIKNSLCYPAREMLETSDIYWHKTKKYYKQSVDFNGEIVNNDVTITMTMTDYKLFREHYNVENFEILDGCYFETRSNLFDEYINKYKKIKLESKGAKRGIAKLFLNNLYGKMAAGIDSSFKLAEMVGEDIKFFTVPEARKKPGYIPIGSAITSYSRNFTIRAAQKNFYGADKRGFIYADTDSIHCDISPDEVKGINIHPKNFCCWALESCWDKAIFVRPKTYIEHITMEDLEPIENPYYDIKCAGMPENCKQLFLKSMEGYEPKETDKFSSEAIEFLKTKRTLKDFDYGLCVPDKLMPKRIKGGIVLKETTYKMR